MSILENTWRTLFFHNMKVDTDTLQFLKVAFRDYKVGAWSPSSRFLVRRVLRYIESNPTIVIECGPGEGVMTRALLGKMSPEGTLIVIEPNIQFVQMLQKIPDRRLRVIEGTVEEVLGQWEKYAIPEADLILSSIPFSFMKPVEREIFISRMYDRLREGGMCIVFHQYYPLAKKILEKVFKRAVVTYEWRNFLPCFVFIAKKGEG